MVYGSVTHGTQPYTSWSMAWYNMDHGLLNHGPQPDRTCYTDLYLIVNGPVAYGSWHGNSVSATW